MLWMPGSYRACSGVYGTTAPNGCNWDQWNYVKVMLAWNAGWRGAMHAWDKDNHYGPPETVASISDGMSNTLLAGEYGTITTTNRRTFWAYAYSSFNQSAVVQGESATLLPDYNACNAVLNAQNFGNGNECKVAWGSFHPGNALNFAMCDGSVRSISTSIDMNAVMPALGSIAGGETAGNLAP
jgi:prepilin-type processing-associated H-X9-DG protein